MKLGQEIRTLFKHPLNASLTQSDFTIVVYKDGEVQSTSVTLTALGSKRYGVDFTPDAVGLWTVNITETLDEEMDWWGEWEVEQHLLDETYSNHDTSDTWGSRLKDLIAIARNKIVRPAPRSSGAYSVMEEDNTTPRLTGTLSADGTTRTPD